MTAGYRHLQASPYLTIEFATTPTYSLLEPVSKLMLHFFCPFLDSPSITLLCVSSPVIHVMASYAPNPSLLPPQRPTGSSPWYIKEHPRPPSALSGRATSPSFCSSTISAWEEWYDAWAAYTRATYSTLHQLMHIFLLSPIYPSTKGKTHTTSMRCNTYYTSTYP